MPALDITQSAAQAVLRSFLLSVLPSDVDVIEAQDNRVPEPANVNFVVMTAIRRNRIETNIDSYVDVLFTGSIIGSTLNVSNVKFGALSIGSPVFGIGVAIGTIITALADGTGGIGNYTVSPAQNVSSILMAGGSQNLMQPTEVTYQLDVHSNVVTTAADMAQAISTAFRDDYATSFFVGINPGVAPLHADEPRQVPFLNAEEQWETRWIIEAHIQVNATLMLPQQFYDSVVINLINVDAGLVLTSIGSASGIGVDVISVTVPSDGIPDRAALIILVADSSNIGGSFSYNGGGVDQTFQEQAPGGVATAIIGMSVSNTAIPGGSTITYMLGQPEHDATIEVMYITGANLVLGNDVFDLLASNTGTSEEPNEISNAPVQAGEMIIAMVASASAVTSFSQDNNNATWSSPPGQVSIIGPTLVGGHVIDPSKSIMTYAPTLGTSVPWVALMIGVRPPSV